MCLLTYLPEKILPNLDALRTGSRMNSDGHGFAIVIPADSATHTRARILVRKSMKAEPLIKEFGMLRALYPDGPALFHSRITTDGVTDLFNCHPFMKGGDKRTVIGHNGILPKSVRPVKGDKRSDTRIFAEEVAGEFRLNSVIGRKLAGEWMGDYNKIVILTVDPAYDRHGYIVNEDSGTWKDGIWYSNSSYQGWRTTSSGYVATGNGWYDGERKWTFCPLKDCPSQAATVSPYTQICTRCKHCAYCFARPCECELVEAVSGKEGSPPWGSSDATASAGGGTVIGGSPGKGATVAGSRGSTTTLLGEYATTVEEYYEALDAAHSASQGVKEGGYVYYDEDVPPHEDDRELGDQLAEVMALVEHLNNGGDLDDWPTDSAARRTLDRWIESKIQEHGDNHSDVRELTESALLDDAVLELERELNK